jgi:predicted CXXCH cytochrome family protein
MVIAGVLAIVGCSTPRERYVVLSTFFDGVPDPDKKVVVTQQVVEDTGPQVVTSAIVSRHKPYVESQCASSHQVGGAIAEFEVAYQQCLKCHKKVTGEHPRMHGPVALAACQWCHAPHESTEKFLLKDTPVKVCAQCHDQNLLSPVPVQHTDGSNCLVCHGGHGGTERYFLKPDAHPEWPSTRPAATQPTTAPAPEKLRLQALDGEGVEP